MRMNCYSVTVILLLFVLCLIEWSDGLIKYALRRILLIKNNFIVQDYRYRLEQYYLVHTQFSISTGSTPFALM